LPDSSTPIHIARIALALVLIVQTPVSAQDVTEPALKGVFIYNFAKFTEWPVDAVPAAAPLVMCVLGDVAVGDALERAVKGRIIAGHAVTVLKEPAAASQQVCNVIYVSGVTADQAAQLVAGVRDVPVLTISDVEGFTELGGIVRFFFESGRLRFAIDLGSAKRARLQISSNLLALAKRQ
jgi:hypothetical protein